MFLGAFLQSQYSLVSDLLSLRVDSLLDVACVGVFPSLVELHHVCWLKVLDSRRT